MRMLSKLILLALLVAVPSIADATTYWVATTGSNANTCASIDGDADPGTYKATPSNAITSCLAAGDTLMIKNGTYTDWWDQIIPAGTSDSVRTIIRAENLPTTTTGTHNVTIRPSSGNFCIQLYNNTKKFITVRGIKCDMVNSPGLQSVKLTTQNGPVNGYPQSIRFEFVEATGSTTISNPFLMGNENITSSLQGCCHQLWNVWIHDNGVSGNSNSLYWNARDTELLDSVVGPNTGAGLSIFISNGGVPTNARVERNIIFDNGVDSSDACIILSGAPSPIIRRNLIYGCAGYGMVAEAGVGDVDNGLIDNNTVYDNVQGGIRIANTASTGNVVRNNIVLGNGGTQLSICSGCGTATTNTTTGTLADIFVDHLNGDFALKAGSTPIDAGTDIGLGHNGTAPDTGAHETITHASCAVEAATPTVINIIFNNNVNPPLLPASSITGFSARENAAAKTVSSATRVGDNQVNVTVSVAFSGGTTIDYSYATASGNVTDSALIGDSKNQRLNALTNQPCTNNVSGAPSHVFTQSRFAFYEFYGTESGGAKKPHSAVAEGTNVSVVTGAKIALRLKMTCTTADCPALGIQPRFSRNAGTYIIIPDSFGVDNIRFIGNGNIANVPTEGTATTERLTSDHVTNVAGQVVRTSSAIPTVDFSLNSEIELLYYIEWDSDVAVSDTFDFRLYNQDGTALNAYTVTPRATIIPMTSGSTAMEAPMPPTALTVSAQVVR